MAGYLSTDPDAGKPSASKYLSTDPSAGTGSDPLSVPDAQPRGYTPPAAPKKGFADSVSEGAQGGIDAVLGMAGGVAGDLSGKIAALVTKFGGGQDSTAAKTGEKVRDIFAYKPAPGSKGPDYLDAMGRIARSTGLDKFSGMGPMALPAAPAIARTFPENRMGFARTMAKDIPDSIPTPPVDARSPNVARFASGGSAAIPEETLRRQRADQLPVPIKLTKGQATRSFEDQRFERETAKDPKVGEPIRQRFAEQNEAMDRNLYAFIDQTGAAAPDLRGAGLSVDAALTAKARRMKSQYQAAYRAAEDAGELAQPVKTTELVKWVNENRSSAKLAPVISAVQDELIRLKGAALTKDGQLVAGRIPLNDLEKTRKMVIRLSKADETNGHFGTQANRVIDAMTEGKGGEEYGKARSLFKKYADEFKGQGVVNKLMSTKPGTKDRAVAFEDVFKHSILNSSYDEALGLRRTLQKEGEQGHQAWRELQGQTVKHLRDLAFEGTARDVRGNPILSPAKLDKAIRELDKDGKLDMILTKSGAQQLRELNDLAKDVYTAPPGSVNFSNTSSVILDALGKVPVAGWLTSAIKFAQDELKNRKVKAQVREHLADPGQIPQPP